MHSNKKIAIIGAGLSGLYTAWKLQKNNYNYILLEARNRTGGRILSTTLNSQTQSHIDLGPAWVWPQLQPRLNNLLSELNIELFKQFTDGDMLYEVDPENIQRHSGPSSHAQSYRITNGAISLVDILQSQLDNSCIQLNTQVISIDQQSLSINTIQNNKEQTYNAEKIILALPPRIANTTIAFTPPLKEETQKLWDSTPTWMAGHCKIVFIYEKAFWREQNLSGEVFSHYGPLTEIYDGSPDSEEYFALTSFVGLNAQQRKQINREELIEHSIIQLERLFGSESKNILDVKIKDWSLDQYTTTDIDLNSVARHPEMPESESRHLWNNQLILAGTEVAHGHGGYLEGALESADHAISLLLDQ